MIALKKIESDVDGVLANMDGSYAQYVKDLIPDFCEEKYILNWNMPEVEKGYPEAFKRIQSLYSKPEFFRNISRYPNIEQGLQKLQKLIEPLGTEFFIHTHVWIEDCQIERRQWLEALKCDSGVNFDIDISSGDLKTMHTDSTILIEDNVRNCTVSNAPIKILVRRGHNRSFTAADLGECQYAFVVNSFCEAVDVIEQLIQDKKVG